MTNPLMAFQPHERIFVNLPTGGKFYAEGVIDLSEGPEIGVKPMSAKDEMMLHNPDALMNGRAVTTVIKNCVPKVLLPQHLAVSDVEAILLAIKLASNEESYDINTKCPECKKEGAFSRDIDYLLQTITFHKDEYMFELDNGLVIYLKPNTWVSHSRLQQVAFRQQRLVAVAQDDSITDQEKQDIFSKVFDEMIDLNMDLVSDCIAYIQTPNGDVTDVKYIREYIDTLTKKELDELGVIVESINSTGVEHSMDVCCSSCRHEWTIEGLRFDPSYFFAQNFSSHRPKK